jgi:transposase
MNPVVVEGMSMSRSRRVGRRRRAAAGAGVVGLAGAIAPGGAGRLIALGGKARRSVERIAARHSGQYRVVVRARIVLAADDGLTAAQIAAAVGVSVPTVRRRLDRYRRRGTRGLFDAPRPGRPEIHGPSARLLVIAVATSTPPGAETAWTHGLIRAELAGRGYRMSRATVGRVLQDAEVRPHKVRGWLNRRDDPEFWEQAGAVCRLYLNPPPGALLVSVDEKTGIQARSRRHPTHVLGDGSKRREFEYRRHGTVSIIAAMDVATGQVIAERIHRNDSQTFIDFLTRLAASIPDRILIHLIMDNGSSHTSKATRSWITAHPRFTITYTPKHASWLNMVEQFFSVLTRRALRNGDFTSQDDLADKITVFTIRHNQTARPIDRRYDADADHARHLQRHPTTHDTLPAAA